MVSLVGFDKEEILLVLYNLFQKMKVMMIHCQLTRFFFFTLREKQIKSLEEIKIQNFCGSLTWIKRFSTTYQQVIHNNVKQELHIIATNDLF